MQANLVHSGFQSKDRVPFITLEKISNELESRDTCSNRMELQQFRITTVDDNRQNLIRNLNALEDIYDGGTLLNINRRFTSLMFLGRFVDEPETGFYRGLLDYEVMAEKEFTRFKTPEVSGNDFWEALYNLYLSSEQLQQYTKGFVTSTWGSEEWSPTDYFLSIPEFDTDEEIGMETTCNTRQELTSFEIEVHGTNPDQIEIILEEVDNNFSYAKLTTNESNRRWTNLEWMGDSLEEIEAEIWRGAIQYEVMYEKDK